MMALPEKSRKLGVGTNQSSTSMNLKRKVLINAFIMSYFTQNI